MDHGKPERSDFGKRCFLGKLMSRFRDDFEKQGKPNQVTVGQRCQSVKHLCSSPKMGEGPEMGGGGEVYIGGDS